MTRSPGPRRRNALRATAAALAIAAATAATATAAPPPKSLTNQFPLGSKTLTHGTAASHTATTSHSQSAATPPPKQATTPAQPAQPARPATPTHATARHHASTSHGVRNAVLIGLVALVIVLVLVDRLLTRRGHKLPSRPRRQIPRWLLRLLSPVYRHDERRDAWILRLVGSRFGPVLRPHDYHPRPWHDPGTEDHPRPTATMPEPADTPEPAATPEPADTAAPPDTPEPAGTPEPPATPSPFTTPTAGRARPRREDRSTATRQEHEPPPLVIRRRPE